MKIQFETIENEEQRYPTVGDENKMNSLLSLLQGFGVKEVCRTGKIAMTRGFNSADHPRRVATPEE